jgi:FG-GAP-like repeat
MDGPNLIACANVGFNPGAPWHVVDTGDFNGDSMSDILWQHDDGSVAVWTMDGHSVIAGANVGFNPGAAWHVKNATDFGGDGKADILFLCVPKIRFGIDAGSGQRNLAA